jgi:predicted molibdopterin-dependent oxidoreductase YjgC
MAERTTGIAKEKILQAAKWWGPAKTSFLLHARGIEHQSKGVENVLACINLVLATGRIGKPYCGYATITGQGNGQGGREHGHKCDQLPGNRDIENPEHRKYISSVWGIDEKDMPGKGLTAYEIMEAIHRGEIKGLISICFNPLVSLPNNNMIREALEKLEYYVCIDFFLNETARHANLIRPAHSTKKKMAQSPRRTRRHPQGGESSRQCPDRYQHPSEIYGLGAEKHFTHNSSGRFSRAARRLQGRHGRLLRHHLQEDRGQHGNLLAVS